MFLSPSPDALAVDARQCGTDELLVRRECLQYELADISALYGHDPAMRALLAGSLRAVGAELERRTRLRQRLRVPDLQHAAWAALAGEIRQRVDLADLLQRQMRVSLRRKGHNGRRDCDEYAGPCPFCGGEDRFVVWSGPPGYCLCRQCGFNGDAIGVYRQHTGASFREALTAAAADLGLAVPSPELPAVAVTIEQTTQGDVIRVRRERRYGA